MIKKTKAGLLMLLLAISLLMAKQPTKDDAVSLVKATAQKITANATETIGKINSADAEFMKKELDDLYVFVFDENVNTVAHAAKPGDAGKSMKGKKDRAGKPFCDLIVESALKNNNGWDNYIFTKPSENGIVFVTKTVYYELTEVEGKKYIICSGIDTAE